MFSVCLLVRELFEVFEQTMRAKNKKRQECLNGEKRERESEKRRRSESFNQVYVRGAKKTPQTKDTLVFCIARED